MRVLREQENILIGLSDTSDEHRSWTTESVELLHRRPTAHHMSWRPRPGVNQMYDVDQKLPS